MLHDFNLLRRNIIFILTRFPDNPDIMLFLFFTLLSFSLATNTHLPLPIPVFETRDSIASILESEGLLIGAELGVLEGEFAKSTLQKWPTCKHYVLVDLWQPLKNYHDKASASKDINEKRMQKAISNTDSWKDKVEVCRNFTTSCAAKYADASFDYVYIDARHSRMGVLEDLNAWWPKLKHNGLACGHDFINCEEAKKSGQDWCLEEDGSRDTTGGAVKGAVIEFAAAYKRQVQVGYREQAWNSWCIRR